MERIKGLDRYQKGILIVMCAMILLFAVIYLKTLSTVGYRYHDVILVKTEEAGNSVFSGQIQGKQARFIVSDAHTVTFSYGDQSYGEYVWKEDPTAIPKETEFSEQMTGIEISNGDTIVFRGGVLDTDESAWLFHEDGTLDDSSFFSMTSDRAAWDANGHTIDPMAPSASTIYTLSHDPQLTHKGDALGWFAATALCVLNALSILFADELFRWNLLLHIRNAENAEPSDWEIAGRYITWTIMTIAALAIFVVGLQ